MLFESGRETKLLEDIKLGQKTIECRLRRGKFAKYQPGDQVWLREDTYEGRQILSSQSRQVLVEVITVEPYGTFKEMLRVEGYKNIAPRAGDEKEALELCYQFYTPAQEKEFGVLAIHFKVLEVAV